jgi:acyl transferase domain-containing protein/acyl carrier protein
VSDRSALHPPCDIAVVATAALYADSREPAEFWRNIVAGRDLLTDVPRSHWLAEDFYDPDPKKPGKVYSRRGSFLPEIDFDPLAFGIPPSILKQTDAAQLLTLWVTQQLLGQTISLQGGKVARDRVSVVVGFGATELMTIMSAKIQRPVWEKAMRAVGVAEEQIAAACDRIFASYPEWTEATFPGMLGNVVAGRIANRFDFGAANFTVDAACASSLAAVSIGIQQLRLGEADLAVVGGADTLNNPHMYMCFSKTPALSPTEDCKPFSDEADGTMMGEGVGLMALRRLSDAERDGDRILAVIRGVGSGSDGRAKSVYAPRPEGQSRALARAYEQAGFSPAEIGLLEAHGTGTVAGDAAEFEGLTHLFGAARGAGRQWCALGSLKSQFGHTKAAAGVAGLFKVVMALHHRVLPPTIKVDRPNPALRLEESPFYLNTRTRPWVVPPGVTRKAAVSSFGFGGTNFHLVVEEYVPPAPAARGRLRTAPKELLPFAAADAAELGRVVDEFLAAPGPQGSAAWLARVRAQQRAFTPGTDLRLVVLAADRVEAERHLAAARARLAAEPTVMWAQQPGAWWLGRGAVGSVAFLFPGQGSHYVEMGRDLACEFDAARAVWDRAAALDPAAVPPLGPVVFPKPVFTDADRAAQSAALTRTEHAQPALGAASLALLALLREVGVTPAMVGGHSYGELVALHAAGAIEGETDLLKLSAARGRAMAQAAATTSGAMLAASADPERVRAAFATILDIVFANLNSPRQTVLAGPVAAIAAAENALRGAQISTVRLPVATAFHSPVVASAVAPFGAALDATPIASPRIPVYANQNAAPYPSEPDAVRRQLAQQLAAPVRFSDQVAAMHAAGARIFVEVGPGQVLTRLTGDILAGKPHVAVALDDRKTHGVTAFFSGLGALAAAGVPIRFDALWSEFAAPLSAPTELSKATVRLDGAQYGKPYPNRLPPAPAPRAMPAAAVPPVPVVPSVKAVPAAVTAPIAPPPPPAPARTSAPIIMSPPVSPSSGPEPGLPASIGLPAAVAPDVAASFVALQQNMLAALQAHQRALHEGFSAYVRASETALRQLGGAPAGAEMPAPTAWSNGNGHGNGHAPVALSLPAHPGASNGSHNGNGHAHSNGHGNGNGHAPQSARALVAPTVARASRPPFTPPVDLSVAPLAPAKPAPAPSPAPVATPPAAPAAPATGAAITDPAQLLFSVVAEATGYPPDMLKPEMQLEADLGIDSIKRVEIFSALSGKVPALGSVEPSQVAQLATLGAIIDFLRAATSGAASGSTPAPTPSVPPSAATVETLVPREEARPPLGFSMPGLRVAAPAFLTLDDSGIAAPLAARLQAAGLPATCGDQPPSNTRLLICLDGLRAAPADESPTVRLHAAFAAIRAAASGLREPGAILVVVYDTARDPWSAGLAGLARTAAREWSGLRVRLIDCDSGTLTADAVADRIARELFTGFDTLEVRLARDGERFARVWRPAPAPGNAAAAFPPLPARATWLVSGGARGITPACLAALAREAPGRFALLGRSAPQDDPSWAANHETETALRRAFVSAHAGATPADAAQAARGVLAAREIRDAIALLTRTGSEVRVLTADVTDAAAVARAAAEVRAAWGPIHGVVHAAGVLADKHIAEKTDAQFQRVLAPKIDGFRALLAATRDDPLVRLAAFTSVAGVFGNAGQADYAAANAALDAALAAEQARRGSSCAVRAFAWGPWEGGMVTPALRQHFTTQGIALIPRDAGAAHFAREMLAPSAEAGPLAAIGPGIARWAPAEPVRGDELQADIWLEPWVHPRLGDHRVDGVPVLPIAMASEFCSLGAFLLAGGQRLSRVTDLRVLKGVLLPGDTGQWLTLRARRVPGAPFHAAISAADNGRELYRLDAEFTSAPHAPAPAPEWTRAPLPAWPDTVESVRARLFHGPRYQSIVELRGCAEKACAVTLEAAPMVPGEDHPERYLIGILLDGGAHAALAHELRTGGAALLPQRVALQEFYCPFPADRRAIAHLRRTHDDKLQQRWDMAFLDPRDGHLIALVEGLLLLKRPVVAAALAG